MKVPENIDELRRNIQIQLADMSRSLEKMNNDDVVVREARTSFLKLSALVGRALDIELQ
jgi:predicted transcriptional regulator